nr:uncharacterized protein LOC105473655 [Macaca nemestrina]
MSLFPLLRGLVIQTNAARPFWEQRRWSFCPRKSGSFRIRTICLRENAKRDPRRGTASGWERTLTTQNSFTNGLVLGFSSLSPQISLPEPQAYSDLVGSGVPQEQVGCCSGATPAVRVGVPKGRGHPEFPTKHKKNNFGTSARICAVSALPQSDDTNLLKKHLSVPSLSKYL